ncbi:hypothetical protein KTR66_24050 [Roseococcus sp. SDR]|uniref:hypothetical protein n=1 Tax=Roseococcus sp. SDR TaxID=2835532 RepID=UPI001BCD656A|nr:hypothetical protein [Roseococcus sp. SDR]MBS7793076.1 hypothetical protein [Roseococcus sp. SDR]MBV1848390.1 hypothetical protein [Roseococcus sp. SDR]
MTENRRWPARPTSYKGRKLRSRLEAKWAAFFDSVSWHWEYEPEAIGGWMPDFLIFGPSGRIYVEVKPDHLLPGAEAKVARAMGALGRKRFGLVVGEAPWFANGLAVVGRAFGEVDTGFEEPAPIVSWADARLVTDRRSHPLPFDLIAPDLVDLCLLAPGNETSGDVVACDEREVRRLWAAAANSAMWQRDP